MSPALFSLHYTQPSASEHHAVSVRGAPTLVLTIRRLKAAVSPLELHANRPNNLNLFLPMGYGYHQRTIIIHKQQREKKGSKHCDLAQIYP